MGSSQSTIQSTIIPEKITYAETQKLLIAFDEFIQSYCELGPDFYTPEIEMHSAICTFLDRAGLNDERMKWSYYNANFIFNHLAALKKLPLISRGVIAYRVYIGIRIVRWPNQGMRNLRP